MIFKRKKVDEPTEESGSESAQQAQEGQTNGASAGQSNGSQDAQPQAEPDQNEQKIAKLEQEVKVQHENYLRALADFENYKKRAIKERSDLIKYQGERIFVDLLEVLDNFERALNSSDGEGTAFRSGVELISKQLTEILNKHEVRADSAVGKEFDPSKHEAINQVEVDDAKPGTVLSELKKAYFYRDKLLRPGQVVIAAARSSKPEEDNSNEAVATPDEKSAEESGS